MNKRSPFQYFKNSIKAHSRCYAESYETNKFYAFILYDKKTIRICKPVITTSTSYFEMKALNKPVITTSTSYFEMKGLNKPVITTSTSYFEMKGLNKPLLL